MSFIKNTKDPIENLKLIKINTCKISSQVMYYSVKYPV